MDTWPRANNSGVKQEWIVYEPNEKVSRGNELKFLLDYFHFFNKCPCVGHIEGEKNRERANIMCGVREEEEKKMARKFLCHKTI